MSGSGSSLDPWREDLFQPHLPRPSGHPGRPSDGPEAMRLDPLEVIPGLRTGDRDMGRGLVESAGPPAGAEARTGAAIVALADLVLTVLPKSARFGSLSSRTERPVEPAAARSRRLRRSRPNSPSRESC